MGLARPSNQSFEDGRRQIGVFFIVVAEDNLPQLIHNLDKVERFVDKLGLNIHPNKKYEIPYEDGVDFLGAKVYWDHIIPGKRIAKNFAKTLYHIETTGKGKLDSISSYDGHLAHFNSHRLSNKIYGGLGWDYQYPKLKKKHHKR